MRKKNVALILSGIFVLALPVLAQHTAVTDDSMPVTHLPKFFINTIFRGTKGIILPLCPTSGREASPTEGRMHYNTTTHMPEFFNGTSWGSLAGSSGGILSVANGGTGASSLTLHGVVLGQGTGAVHITAAGTAAYPLLSGGAGADPSFGQLNLAGVGITGTLPVGNGGTGATNFVVGQSAAMTAGTITIATANVTASSKIQLTHAGSNVANAGILSVGTITPGVSFVINSTNAADTDTVNYEIVN